MPADPSLLAVAVLAALFAGVVKGAVGFAMPMILISSLGSVMPPDLALAALLMPTLVSNLLQAFRQGVGAALASTRAHAVYIGVVALMIALSAQLVTLMSDRAMFLTLGTVVAVFALTGLAGWVPKVPPERRRVAEVGIGTVAGLSGGLSGVWGPPTVLYLTALATEKVEQVRVQGVVYGLGSVVLVAAHVNSGILDRETAPLSAALVIPAFLGVLLGFRLQDRMDQVRFRRWTLVVLVVASLNLIRRGLGF